MFMYRYHHAGEETLTREGAQRLAADIENYWVGRGYRGLQMEVAVFKDYHDHHPMFMVRSNMVNGLPPRETAR
jgi:hypothetical protein